MAIFNSYVKLPEGRCCICRRLPYFNGDPPGETFITFSRPQKRRSRAKHIYQALMALRMDQKLWNTIGIPLEYHWNTIGIPLEYHWNTIGIPLEYHWNTIGIPLEYHWNTIGIPLEYHWNTIGIPLEYHWNTIGIPLEYHWNTIIWGEMKIYEDIYIYIYIYIYMKI